MSVLIATNDSPEGQAALKTGVAEAELRGLPVLWMNLGDRPVDTSLLPAGAREVPRPAHLDAVDALLDAAAAEDVALIALGVRQRSRVGKLLLGSAVQRIVLESTVPVIAVKPQRSE